MCAAIGAGTILAQPVKSGGKKLVIALHSESANYDISNAHSAALAELVCGNVNEKLLDITTDGKLIPELAESWKASPNGKEISSASVKGSSITAAMPSQFETSNLPFSG